MIIHTTAMKEKRINLLRSQNTMTKDIVEKLKKLLKFIP